jgi:hypothetical protein
MMKRRNLTTYHKRDEEKMEMKWWKIWNDRKIKKWQKRWITT